MFAPARTLWLLAAFLFCSVLTLQYPLSTTFPIGGDTTRYILKLLEVKDITSLLTNTWYPGMQIFFSVSTLLPLSWPERFIWWMVLGHLFTAVSLAVLLNRLHSWRSAAAGMALWSLTVVTLTPHVQDATLAQAWSLGFVVLCLYEVTRGSLFGAVAMAFLATITHPLSGAVLLLTLSISLPAFLMLQAWRFSALSITSTILSIALAIRYYEASLAFPPDSFTLSTTDVLKSSLGPFLLLGLIGLITFFKSKRIPNVGIVLISSFMLVSLLLTFNNYLEITVLINRFQSYAVITGVILAALGLPTVLRMAFSSTVLQSIIAILLFASAGFYTWQDNAPIFHYYESPSRYGRLSTEEQAAIEWMKNNLPKSSVIVSTKRNRHSEWVPILSGRSWVGLSENDVLWQTSTTDLPTYIASKPYTHAVFFRSREKASERFSAGVTLFPVIFENKGATIIKLKQP